MIPGRYATTWKSDIDVIVILHLTGSSRGFVFIIAGGVVGVVLLNSGIIIVFRVISLK